MCAQLLFLSWVAVAGPTCVSALTHQGLAQGQYRCYEQACFPASSQGRSAVPCPPGESCCLGDLLHACTDNSQCTAVTFRHMGDPDLQSKVSAVEFASGCLAVVPSVACPRGFDPVMVCVRNRPDLCPHVILPTTARAFPSCFESANGCTGKDWSKGALEKRVPEATFVGCVAAGSSAFPTDRIASASSVDACTQACARAGRMALRGSECVCLADDDALLGELVPEARCRCSGGDLCGSRRYAAIYATGPTLRAARAEAGEDTVVMYGNATDLSGAPELRAVFAPIAVWVVAAALALVVTRLRQRRMADGRLLSPEDLRQRREVLGFMH